MHYYRAMRVALCAACSPVLCLATPDRQLLGRNSYCRPLNRPLHSNTACVPPPTTTQQVASMFHFTMCFNMLKPVPGVPRPGHGLPLAGQGDDNAASSPRRRSSAAATSPRGAGRKLHRQVSDLAVADWARRMGSSVRRQFSSGRRGSADIEAAAATAVVDVDAARGSRRGEWLPLLQVNDSSSSSSAWGAKSPQQPNGGSSGPAAGRAASGDAAPPAAGSSSPSDAGGEQQHGLPSLERRSLRQSQGQGFRRLPSISEGLDKEGEQPSSPRGPEEGNSGTGGQQQSQQWALEVEGPGGRAAAGAPSSSPSSLSSSTAAGGLQGGSGGPSPPLAPSDAGSSGRPAAAGLSWLRVWEVAKGFIVQLKSPPVLSCLVSIPVGTIAPLKVRLPAACKP